MPRARGLLGLLEAMDILTPERLERLQRRAAKTGAVRVARAARAYNEAVAEYKAGRAKPLALAHAHAELVAALEQNAKEVHGLVSRIGAFLQSGASTRR